MRCSFGQRHLVFILCLSLLLNFNLFHFLSLPTSRPFLIPFHFYLLPSSQLTFLYFIIYFFPSFSILFGPPFSVYVLSPSSLSSSFLFLPLLRLSVLSCLLSVRPSPVGQCDRHELCCGSLDVSPPCGPPRDNCTSSLIPTLLCADYTCSSGERAVNGDDVTVPTFSLRFVEFVSGY